MSINMDALIAKRAEVLGEGHKFDIELGGKKFWLVAPELASEEWNRTFEALQEDLREGIVSTDDFREEFLNLLLEDQVEEFRKATEKLTVDSMTVARMALEEHAEVVGKARSRKSLRNTRTSAKRR